MKPANHLQSVFYRLDDLPATDTNNLKALKAVVFQSTSQQNTLIDFPGTYIIFIVIISLENFNHQQALTDTRDNQLASY